MTSMAIAAWGAIENELVCAPAKLISSATDATPTKRHEPGVSA